MYNVIITITIMLVMTCQAKYLKWNQVITPYLYLGNTPYQNMTFNSPNISTALRIQRDIAMNITIDQLVWPALDMSTAFFGNDYSTQRLSEMNQPLSMGYKRLVLDLYYDFTRSNWQLCPVSINSTSLDDVFIAGYTCQPTFLFTDFLNQVNTWLVSTETGRASTITDLLTLVLNLHDVSSPSNTTIETNLGDIILNSLSKSSYAPRIYTPHNLTMDRVNIIAQGQQTSLWPTWLYLIQHKVQILVGFGTVQQNASFVISDTDQSIIFNASSINGASGGMDLSNTVIPTTTTATDALSWSFINDDETLFSYQTALSVTQYGYSPYFTHANYSDPTSGYTAIDSGHLADNVLSTIWSWDVDQPDTTNPANRCAAMFSGRWVAYNCAQPLHVACQLATDPNQWTITKSTFDYDRAFSACPQNYMFEVPRVPRQNLYLSLAILEANITTRVWLNLNMALSDHGASCWVVGRYSTCWWTNQTGEQFIGLIKTSVVAGVIILILVGIFTWIKCATVWRNRNSKSRKALVKAMLARSEYVTVPA